MNVFLWRKEKKNEILIFGIGNKNAAAVL